MKNTFLLYLLTSISFLLLSCEKDNDSKKSESNATGSFTFNSDKRTYPLSNSKDGRYRYYTAKADFPATGTTPARSRLSFMIDDKDKKYIGDIGGYKGAQEFDLGLFLTKNMVATISETPTKINLGAYLADMSDKQAQFVLSLAGNDPSKGLASLWPVTGQSAMVSKKGNIYYIDISYIKMEDSNGKQVVMQGLSYNTSSH